jgi:hypothetical protein
MRNGMWKLKHKHLNHEVYCKAYNGNIGLYRLDSINGQIQTFDYIGRADDDKIKEDYIIIEEVKLARRFNLVWYMNGVIKETIVRNGHYGFCEMKRQELKRTTHKSGLLVIQRVVN